MSVDREANRRRVASMAQLRRNTVMLARDVFSRRFSRGDALQSSYPQRFTVEELVRLVHEVNHQVAIYRQLLQVLGTHSDTLSARKELVNTRLQCLKTCDTTKNCVLPQLKSETHEGVHSQEFTKQASQFIGSMGCFVSEMRHCHALLKRFPNFPTANQSEVSRPADQVTVSSAQRLPSNTEKAEGAEDSELENLTRDITEAEAILETLENLITVHFSTKDQQEGGGATAARPRPRRKGCPSGNLCSNFKTSYA